MISSLDLALLRFMTVQIRMYRPYASGTNGDVETSVTENASQSLIISLLWLTL